MAAPQLALSYNDVFDEDDEYEPKEAPTVHHIRANSSIMQVKKILVANRGEIPIRIFRTAHELSLHTIAVYSYEDRLSMHRQSRFHRPIYTQKLFLPRSRLMVSRCCRFVQGRAFLGPLRGLETPHSAASIVSC
jgi:hypothetical protein